MAKTVDVVHLRERRRRRKRLIRLLIVAAVTLMGALIYASRDKIFSSIQEISIQHATNLKDESNGEFMLTVSGGVDYHADFVSNELFVLCDKYLYIYGTDGQLQDSRQHAYSNAVMKISRNKALTYSWNGTSFRVDDKKKMIYEAQTEQPIWFAVLSEEGYAAIVTESETYACRLSIFDSVGKLIYTRDCVERLIDVAFQGNSGCIFATIGAENGEPVTTLQSVRFDGSEVQWTSETFAALCLHIYTLEDNSVFVIGDTHAAYYNSTGGLISIYEYNGLLTDFDFAGNEAAVLLRNEERRQSVLLLFSPDMITPVSIPFDSICKTVKIQENAVYLLDTGTIRGFSFSGTEIFTMEVKDVFDRILKNGKYFYLLGYDRIQRVNAS